MPSTTYRVPLALLLALLAFVALSLPVRAQTADGVRAGVRDWVAGQVSVAPDLVDVAPLDARVKVPPCPAGYAHDWPFASRDTVRVRCDAVGWQLYVRVSLSKPQSMVVAARPLAAGRVLAADDLTVKALPRNARDGFETPAAIVGRIVRAPIAAGAPVFAADLEDGQTLVRLAQAVKAGTALKSDLVKLETVARNRVPPGAVTGLAALDDARAVRDLPAGHLLLAADLAFSRQAMVARKALAAGQLAEPALFELAPVPARDASVAFVTDLRGHEHSELARTLQPGEPLRASDLRPAVLVRRGDAVTLTVRTSGGLEITLRAEALQDGRYGERVNLKNPESGRVLPAIVTGKNTARGT